MINVVVVNVIVIIIIIIIIIITLLTVTLIFIFVTIIYNIIFIVIIETMRGGGRVAGGGVEKSIRDWKNVFFFQPLFPCIQSHDILTHNFTNEWRHDTEYLMNSFWGPRFCALPLMTGRKTNGNKMFSSLH